MKNKIVKTYVIINMYWFCMVEFMLKLSCACITLGTDNIALIILSV